MAFLVCGWRSGMQLWHSTESARIFGQCEQRSAHVLDAAFRAELGTNPFSRAGLRLPATRVRLPGQFSASVWRVRLGGRGILHDRGIV
jgi:hypothetical protein